MKRIIGLTVLAICVLCVGCSSGNASSNDKFDKKNPVNLMVWHYYNGPQKTAFDNLVTKFNETEGKTQGIYVESHSKGDVSELETAVLSASQNEVGSDEMPNIFSAYADTAYVLDQNGILADLSGYVTKEELSEYEDSYIEEGRIGADGELIIFPVAKSTEVLMLNKTVWTEFSAQESVREEELKTTDGIARVAEKYYNWTDAATPGIPNDGKAFYGRDAMANLFIATSMQMGTELFKVENQKVIINVDREVFKNIWDTYYIPYVKGYFGAFGRFRSDDVKIGLLAAYTGSVASAGYFPDRVEEEEVITPISCMVLPAPFVKNGEPYIIQQGAGMVVTKKSAEEESASVQFLKWFTQSENNMEFCSGSCYLPVKKDADKKEVLDKVLSEQNVTLSDKEYDTLIMAYDLVNNNQLYTNRAFENGAKARKILEFNLADKAKNDRKMVVKRLSEGAALEDAVSDLTSDAAFITWFESIKQELKAFADTRE